MVAILLVAGLTLFGSFLCSLFEAALYSITPSQLELLRSEGRLGSRKLARFRAAIEEPIAAILTVNTITHTVGAAACGAMVAREYADSSIAVGVFATLFTVAVLLMTEIIPKSIGVRHAVTIGPIMVWPLQWMIWAVWPIVRGSTFLIRLIGASGEQSPPTEDEVMVLSRLARKGGHLRPEEERWVRNALRLDEVTAHDLMTPRTVVVTLPRETPLASLHERAPCWSHSRIPVTEGEDPDEIVGLVYRREVSRALISGRAEGDLTPLVRPIRFVPESTPGHKLLEFFIGQKRHMVAVVDEYGGFEGVVTLEDVLECMLGAEIVDETDVVEDMQEYAQRKAAETKAARDAADGPGQEPGRGAERSDPPPAKNR